MNDLFDEILDLQWHESITENCEDFDGGLQESEIYYCPYFHVNSFKIPSILGSFTSAGEIRENITCKNRRSFERISALVDMSELSSSAEKSTLKLYVLGLRNQLIGMKRILSRLPGIYIVKDNNDRQFVFGNTLSPAFASVELSTGQKAEDNSGANVTLTSNMPFFEYKGEIPPYRESEFTDEFTFEFT
ncbi:hypothetical protein QP519_10780 [Weeksella virosa]|uniref:hypothetical protein n=1 Tax=Weeksella virosa TaxID=1014 RepID=UPI002552AE4F|nr:hypothetical protein [Weeksella virosa]MDK7376019.1 hypothetical protein [Weeksella virosa]